MATSVIWLLLLSVSCSHTKQQNGKHILDFKSLTIEVPVTWKKIELRGIDSYTGGIAAEDNDTIYFDLGRYPVNLEEYAKIQEQDKTYFIIEDGDGVIIKHDSLAMDSVLKTQVRWTTIDGRKAKIIYPKKSGVGTVGVFIDSLWKLVDDEIFFTMYGNNTSKQTENVFLESMSTLKFLHR